MDTGLLISIFGATTAVIVSIIGARLANRNTIILQTRKLKEEHYVSFMEAIHNVSADNNDNEALKRYVLSRDKLFIIASEDVIKNILLYEEMAVGKQSNLHDEYLTELVKAIRLDLKIKDTSFPKIYLKKAKP